jgi:hypothetical protein
VLRRERETENRMYTHKNGGWINREKNDKGGERVK